MLRSPTITVTSRLPASIDKYEILSSYSVAYYKGNPSIGSYDLFKPFTTVSHYIFDDKTYSENFIQALKGYTFDENIVVPSHFGKVMALPISKRPCIIIVDNNA